MKLILTHDVDMLGKAGEVVEVKDGYGRNYLVPRGYAIKWTKGAQKQIDVIAEARRKRAIDSLETANEIRDALNETAVEIVKAAGDNGRLFGAVSPKEIAEGIEAATGKKVDSRAITVAKPIKSTGAYTATAKLHDDIIATVKLNVKAEDKKRK